MDENSILAMPFVPLRGIVVYPKLLSHIDIGREKSLAAVDYAMEHDRLLIVSAQVDEEVDDPGFDDVYQCGTLVRIQQLLRLPGGLVRILVDGIARVQLQGFSEKKNYLEVAAVKVDEIDDASIEEEALRRVVLKQFADWLENVRNGEEIREKAKAIEEPGAVADFIVSQLPLRLVVRQQILEMAEVKARLRRVMILLDTEVEIANLESSLNMEVRSKMDQQQKEYYLREKIKAIHRELGDKVDKDTETQELREKIHKMKLPKKIEEPLLKEVDRLDSMPPMMAESAIIRTYLDLALELPWKKETKDRLDLKEAQSVLDEDHYGLKQVKDRIIEYLAVRQLTHSLKGPILCFVGPPGTGKTSIARSIARAMNRKYVRISLGGVRDEAEIRGHRPDFLEAEAVGRLLHIAEAVDIPVVIVHTTNAASLREIEAARRRGQKVYVETCPQYLILDDSVYDNEDWLQAAKYVCAPPIRKAADRKALWQAIRRGEVQTVSTDHCSFTTAQKLAGKDDFTAIPGGLPGVETRGELIYTFGVTTRKISLAAMCRVLAENPARLYGMFPRKGIIAEGADADIVVYDPQADHVIRAEDMVGAADYNPYEGVVTRGSIRQVWLRGKLAVNEGRVLAGPDGKYIRRGKCSL